MNKNKKILKIVYEVIISLLALFSVVLVFLDIFSKIDLTAQPFRTIDLAVLGVFWVDYIVRFILSKSKLIFFKSNLFDLIAIIPLNELFSLFRITRLFRLTKLARLSKLSKATRLIRAFAFIGVVKLKIDKFLKTNGFIYMIYCSGGLILFSSFIMSFIEKKSFSDSLWWSIVTCTTVGYGDISPSTGAGRLVAVFLMLFGIGFIGMLTGTITTYFAKNKYVSKHEYDGSDLVEVARSMDEKQRKELLHIANLMKNGTIMLSVNMIEKTK